MTGIELTAGPETVFLACSETPARVTADTIRSVRRSVKSDRAWRVRVPDETLALLAPDADEFVTLGLRVNGEFVPTRMIRTETARILVPLSDPLAGREAAVFEHSIGLAQIEVSLGRGRGSLFAEPVFLAIPKGERSDDVRAMAAFVLERLHHCTNEKECATPGAGSQALERELETRLAAVETTLKTYEQQFAYFRTNARFAFVPDHRIDGVERLTGFSHATLEHVIEHPEELVLSNRNTGIRIRGRSYIPLRTLVETKKKSYDLPENRIVLGFLEHIERSLAGENAELEKRLDELPSLAGADEGYVSSAEAILGQAARRLADYKARVAAYLDHARRIRGEYRRSLAVDPLPYEKTPAPTRLFLSVPAYRRIYECMLHWTGSGAAALITDTLLITAFERSRLFELYCLFRLVEDFRREGFSPVEIRHFAWSRPAGMTGSDEAAVPNTFVLERAAGGTVPFSRIVLWYEPVIRTAAAGTENGLDLVRTSALSFDGESVRMTDEAVSFVTPDFVLRIESGCRVHWLVADAKYMDGWNALAGYTRELLFKYVFGVCPLKEGEKIESLHILYPRSGRSGGPLPAGARTWPVRAGFDIRYELTPPAGDSVGMLAAAAARLAKGGL